MFSFKKNIYLEEIFNSEHISGEIPLNSQAEFDVLCYNHHIGDFYVSIENKKPDWPL